MSIAKYCKVTNCKGEGHLDPKQGKRYLTQGLCSKHYTRKLRGLPLEYSTRKDNRPATIEGNIAMIPLGVGARQGYAIVDKEDAWVDKYNWCLFSNGYVARKGQYLHHLILGNPERGYQADHKNRNRLDNRKSNLRIATSSQNNSNTRKSGKSGYTGVYKNGNKWSVKISKNYKIYHLGTFADIHKAAQEYNKKATELHGEFAMLNNVKGL